MIYPAAYLICFLLWLDTSWKNKLFRFRFNFQSPFQSDILVQMNSQNLILILKLSNRNDSLFVWLHQIIIND